MLSAITRGEYRGTTFGHVAMLAAAVFYIVSPLDFMPEALFGVLGLTDDAVVVTWLVAALVNDTEDFIQWERSGGQAQGFAGGRQDARVAGSAGRAVGRVVPDGAVAGRPLTSSAGSAP